LAKDNNGYVLGARWKYDDGGSSTVVGNYWSLTLKDSNGVTSIARECVHAGNRCSACRPPTDRDQFSNHAGEQAHYPVTGGTAQQSFNVLNVISSGGPRGPSSAIVAR
jgi:hypothetical protein